MRFLTRALFFSVFSCINYIYTSIISAFLSVPSLQWVLDKQDLLKERQKDLKFLTEEEYWKLQIFFANGTEQLRDFHFSCGCWCAYGWVGRFFFFVCVMFSSIMFRCIGSIC